MSFTDLLAYKKSFSLAMKIFEVSKSFPNRKRQYPKHFVSKLTDSDAENSETLTWLLFALECKYIDKNTFDNLSSENSEVGKLINYMINNPGKFGVK